MTRAERLAERRRARPALRASFRSGSQQERWRAHRRRGDLCTRWRPLARWHQHRDQLGTARVVAPCDGDIDDRVFVVVPVLAIFDRRNGKGAGRDVYTMLTGFVRVVHAVHDRQAGAREAQAQRDQQADNAEENGEYHSVMYRWGGPFAFAPSRLVRWGAYCGT